MTMYFGRIQAGDEPDERQTRIVVYQVLAKQKHKRGFFCSSCGRKLLEIEDDLMYMSDASDAVGMNPADHARLVIKCGGPYCKTFYEFIIRPKL